MMNSTGAAESGYGYGGFGYVGRPYDVKGGDLICLVDANFDAE